MSELRGASVVSVRGVVPTGAGRMNLPRFYILWDVERGDPWRQRPALYLSSRRGIRRLFAVRPWWTRYRQG